ncbi:MAG: hypothetical protein JSW02_06720 [candidate division WOR-3 bacterium]|nr:MAG: hypothetical protein JSW02_06720 [candidate division WOR-3 bacterium]
MYKYAVSAVIVTSIMVHCGNVTKADSGSPEMADKVLVLADSVFDEHVKALKARVPDDFTIFVQRPFVVIGNEEPDKVRHRSTRTVKWAIDLLKKDFFTNDPAYIIDIWLFRDKTSYEKYAWELFNDKPETPFGYYLEEEKALLMNISTGGGTLVHEMVHPFMRANFPGCPPWFDEGMASLYEQCGEKGGHIYGYTNWRLEGLQEAAESGRVPSFKTLTAMRATKFYLQDKGTNYAQARYLCYYLQEQGLLVKYYHEFHENVDDDPTGYITLQKVLGVEDMKAFKKKWETFVMKLSFP